MTGGWPTLRSTNHPYNCIEASTLKQIIPSLRYRNLKRLHKTAGISVRFEKELLYKSGTPTRCKLNFITKPYAAIIQNSFFTNDSKRWIYRATHSVFILQHSREVES